MRKPTPSHPAATGAALAAAAAAAVLAPLLGSGAARAALPPVAAASGEVYVDSAGAQHRWSVNALHTLVWDDRPYIPVGGLFLAQSWAKGATDADFQKDVAALTHLKAGGVTDVIVRPARGGITEVAPEAIQRLLDALDAQGFTYGISLNDGPADPLTGYEVRPGAYRLTTPDGGGSMRFPAGSLISALYFVVTPNGQDVLTTGDAELITEGARIDVPQAAGGMIAYLFPEKVFLPDPASGAGTMPNLWDGYDGYRDSLLALFGKVRPGKGLRFFVDPLPANLAITDEMRRIVPDSPGFAAEWSAYLADKYKNLQLLDSAWGIVDRGQIPDFKAAANLIPLWNGGKGVGFYYDRTTKKKYAADASRSDFWRDLQTFTNGSVRRYMNGLATAIKHGVADVPVVYRSRGWSPLLSLLRGDTAFDGVGIVAYGRGQRPVYNGAGEVYAQVSEAGRPLWLPVVGAADTAPPAASGSGGAARRYSTRADLFSAFDALGSIGARGFFLDPLPGGDGADGQIDPAAADTFAWLGAYRTTVVAPSVASSIGAASANNLTTLPGVTYYPRGLDVGTVRLLANGEWWLPTDRLGTPYDFGPSVRAYALTDADGTSTYYFWNPLGRQRTIRIKLPKQTRLPNAPRVQWSAAADGKMKGDVLTLTIGPDPIRLMNVPPVPMPLDAFDEAFADAERMEKRMEQQQQLHAGLYKMDLPYLKAKYKKLDPWIAYSELRAQMAKMSGQLREYAWLEAEGDGAPGSYMKAQTFDAIEELAGSSGGQVLTVGRRAPGMPLASATYSIAVKSDDTFQLWVAASPGAPLTFRLDGQTLLDAGSSPGTTPDTLGATYANGSLAWTYLGAYTIAKGEHSLEVRASGPAMVDAVLFYRGQFAPNGTAQPPVMPEEDKKAAK